MGLVKVDVHKAEREYYTFLLSDPEIIKWMLMYRDVYDVTYSTLEFNTHANDGWNAGDLPKLNQELVCMYADLERLIELCEFNESQKALIELIGQGFTLEEIGDVTQVSKQNIFQNFNTICNQIVERNSKVWKLYVHRSILGTPSKKCVRCHEELPMIEEYFGRDKRRPDGFKSACKGCIAKQKRDSKGDKK